MRERGYGRLSESALLADLGALFLSDRVPYRASGGLGGMIFGWPCPLSGFWRTWGHDFRLAVSFIGLLADLGAYFLASRVLYDSV
ncbi:hypothetical protein [Neobacillus bataviensis]|uniref:hypothetical protein n=1 Tax=Neobacillus bataviensis TaxID=220685 RepID=UPI001CBC0F7C|nr:hypothetical protein [Neobacillus bataviensis]